jgi:hypothetical protein
MRSFGVKAMYFLLGVGCTLGCIAFLQYREIQRMAEESMAAKDRADAALREAEKRIARWDQTRREHDELHERWERDMREKAGLPPLAPPPRPAVRP